jgi:hypothetical protein
VPDPAQLFRGRLGAKPLRRTEPSDHRSK